MLFGVNIITNLNECNGIYSLFCNVEKIISFLKIPYKVYNILEAEIPLYPINIIINNAQGWCWTPIDFLKDRYNVGLWSWELEEFPDIWCNLPFVDEVWTISKFISVSLEKIQQRVEWFNFYFHEIPERYDLTEFQKENNIPKKINLLYIFDINSVLERKNPAQLIRVYSELKSKYPIHLILKILNYREDILSILDDPDITTITKILSKSELEKLYQSCDIYVSPHTTEGFGYTILEAMENGMAVVSTDYGGFKDVVDEDAYLPLKGTLEEIMNNPIYKGKWCVYPDKVLKDGIIQSLENLSTLKLKSIQHQEKYVRDYKNIEKWIKRIYQNLVNKLYPEPALNLEPDLEYYRLSCLDLLHLDPVSLKEHCQTQALKENRKLYYKVKEEKNP